MTPVEQEHSHDPKNGTWGDCHRAALATVLDLPLAEVPHFFHGCPEEVHPDKVWRAMEEWLQPRGFTQINLIYPEGPLDDIMRSIGNCNNHGGSIVYIFGGESRNGHNHSVVCVDGRIAWDPGVDKPGIVGPSKIDFEDGSKMIGYHVTFIGHAVARPGLPCGINRPPPPLSPDHVASTTDSKETWTVCPECGVGPGVDHKTHCARGK